MEHVDAMVVGGGVVGLACAAALARRLSSVVVLERHAGPGRETSSRNSGVVHAGLHYPPDSLEAQLCVEGRKRLYAFCAAHDVPHRRTGKVVVATATGDVPALEAMRARGLAAGAGALELWGAADLARREPALRAVAALYSPDSGLVDAEAFVLALAAEGRAAGADLVFRTRVTALARTGDAWSVTARGEDGDDTVVRADHVVDAAGLEADRLAEMAGIDVDAAGMRQHLCKGDYFVLAPRAPHPRLPLVYPVPSGAGLGIHLTTDLGGRTIAGPDATYVDAIDYAVDASKAAAFADAVARYLPGVTPGDLSPDYAGIRPTLRPPGGAFRDFVIEDAAPHGAPGLVCLVGIESPGLTASLAIAERVAALVTD